jgi:hypothetical protein
MQSNKPQITFKDVGGCGLNRSKMFPYAFMYLRHMRLTRKNRFPLWMCVDRDWNIGLWQLITHLPTLKFSPVVRFRISLKFQPYFSLLSESPVNMRATFRCGERVCSVISNSSTLHLVIGPQCIINWKWCGSTGLWRDLRCMEWLRKISTISDRIVGDYNQVPPEYKCEESPLKQPSLCAVWRVGTRHVTAGLETQLILWHCSLNQKGRPPYPVPTPHTAHREGDLNADSDNILLQYLI